MLEILWRASRRSRQRLDTELIKIAKRKHDCSKEMSGRKEVKKIQRITKEYKQQKTYRHLLDCLISLNYNINA